MMISSQVKNGIRKNKWKSYSKSDQLLILLFLFRYVNYSPSIPVDFLDFRRGGMKTREMSGADYFLKR